MENPFNEDDVAKAKRGEAVKKELPAVNGKPAETVVILPVRSIRNGRVRALRVRRLK